jgi:hypothetical protein
VRLFSVLLSELEIAPDFACSCLNVTPGRQRKCPTHIHHAEQRLGSRHSC